MRKNFIFKIVFITMLLVMCLCFTACSDNEKIPSLPSEPTINSAVAADDGSIDVVLNNTHGSELFDIYRSSAEDSDYVKIGTTAAGEYVYNDNEVDKYKTYYYKVTPGGNSEISSSPVSVFTQGTLIHDGSLKVEFAWENGEKHLMETATDFCTSRQKLVLTLLKNGKPTADYTLYCDEARLNPVKQDDGSTVLNPSVRGNYIVTFKSGENLGSVELILDDCGDSDLSLSWSKRSSDIWNDRIIEPTLQKTSYTVLDGNGEPISGYTVTSSDTRICSVEMVGDRFVLTNNSPGTCFITVNYKGQRTKYEMLVRGGLATKEVQNIEGVTVENGLDPEKASAVIKQFITPQCTIAEIEQMVHEELTLDQYAEKISTAADAINLLYALGYGKEPKDLMKDIEFMSEKTRTGWIFDYSAELNFKLRYGMCAGTSNLMNRLLMDNFDEMGYVMYCNTNEGGHIINYYKVDGIYVICDFVEIIHHFDFDGRKYPADITRYFEYVCTSPEKFFEFYQMTNTVATIADPVEGMMAYLVFYEQKGDPIPTGFPWDDPAIFALPEQSRDICDVIYVRDGCTLEFRPLEEDGLPECRKDTHAYLN